MLEMSSKWFTNTLAKKSMQNNDFVACNDGRRLYVVGYGVLTNSGKNTYNVILKDNEDKIVSEHANLYLDAITKLILGNTPKSKANKDNEATNEATKEKKQTSKQENKECLYLTFDEAFERACKKIESYKDVAKVLGKYDTKDACILALHLIKEANESEKTRIKELKKSEELKSLRQTLELATKQGNSMLVDAITQMIIDKEKE